MKVAALDLGTNTFILLIAEVRDGEIVRVLHDEVRVVRLGQGIHQTRTIAPEAMARAEACFASFAETIRMHQVDRVKACATSAARDARNGAELIALAARHGIPVEIISGEREAELTYRGTVRPPVQSPILIVDVGGGSTEFIYGDRTGILARRSVDIGSVRLTELMISRHPVPEEDLRRTATAIKEAVTDAKRALPEVAVDRITAVAGTPTTLAMVDQALADFSAERVDGYVLSVERLRHWLEMLAGMSVDERQRLIGMEPKRADVIVAGALILLVSMEEFGVRELVVSVRGLRYGLAQDLGSAC